MPKILDETLGSIIVVGAVKHSEDEEIFQVGAVKMDLQTGAYFQEFNLLVRPDGSGLRGQSSLVALKQYINFCRKLPVWIFEEDAFHASMENEHLQYVRPLLAQWGHDPAILSKENIHTAVGATLKERAQDALYYARSLALFLFHIHNH